MAEPQASCVDQWRSLPLFLAAIVSAGAVCAPAFGATVEELQSLSIEQLSQLQVVSVARRPQALNETPAAVFVITAEDIRRSGAVTLPEVLRIAPNLEVAQVTSQTYVVSARGFNATSASNKILFLIDGRIAYEPLQSQVYFDQFQVPLDDIERIEVISGPGGTLWGANAVNGVVDIVTKDSAATQGGLANLKAGYGAQYGLAQYGGTFGNHGTYRVYGQSFALGSTQLTNGANAHDAWHGGQGGYRADWRNGPDHVMTEGDTYDNDGETGQRQYGGNLLARWEHALSDGSSLLFQTSYDVQVRLQPQFLNQYQSYDVQAQDAIPLGPHQVVIGAEYRVVPTDFYNRANIFTLEPARRTIGVGDLYAQDTYAIIENLKLTFGLKLQDSSYTGLEPLPSVRLGWTVSDKTFLWAAVTRASRTPSRLDRDLTGDHLLTTAPLFQSEKLVAFELGYRGEPLPRTTLSVSLFYNLYSDLRTIGFSEIAGGPPLQIQNGEEGTTFGADIWGSWQVTGWWRLSPGLSLLHKNLHLRPGFTDVSFNESAGFDPGYQASLRSSMNLIHHVEFDTEIRQVGGLGGTSDIGPYLEGDARLGWHATERLELSLAGYNLFAPYHTETVLPGSPIHQAPRTVYAGLRWAF